MEFFNETFCLGVDLLVLGFCVREYYSNKKILNSLKNAEHLQINNDLKKYVSSKENKKIPCVVLWGNVCSIGSPIRGVLAPLVNGPIHIMKINEHTVARDFTGLWNEHRKLIHMSSNYIPFTVNNDKVGVEIFNGITADKLDLDVVYDYYEPAKLSFFDHILGFFSGERQRGIHTTEEMLREGSFITAIGELGLEDGNLKLQSSESGPLFLIKGTKATLIKQFEGAKSSSIIKIVVCGTISVVLIAVISWRIFNKRKIEKEKRKFNEDIQHDNHENISENLVCVICLTNPKQVILLPCGHVCLCKKCANAISTTCPLCRKTIDSKRIAFL